MEINIKLPFENLCVSKIYLFGSGVKGTGKDLDILVISDDFIGVSRQKRIEKVALNFIEKKVDPICHTINEFNGLLKQKSIFLNKILNESVLIYESNIH